MTAKRYAVDWTDRLFPTIKLVEGIPGFGKGDGVTLGQAKADIIGHFQGEVEHARYMIRETRSLRARDIHAAHEAELERRLGLLGEE